MVHKNVKKIMLDKDLKYKNLIEKTGYSRPHLSAVINGRVDSIHTKKAICLVLDKDFKELWEEPSRFPKDADC